MANYTEAAIGPEDQQERVLYSSPKAARQALIEEIVKLRHYYRLSLDVPEELNATLDALEVAGDEFLDYFTIAGRPWTAWYRPTSPPGGHQEAT
jgi:hypothetical protein